MALLFSMMVTMYDHGPRLRVGIGDSNTTPSAFQQDGFLIAHSPGWHPLQPCEIIGTEVDMPRCRPSITIIAAQKCGTNALSTYLGTHPRVLEDPHENHFFTYKSDGMQDPRQNPVYLNRFVPLPSDFDASTQVSIERSHSYMVYPGTAAKYHRYFPGSKVLASICDPVARLWSEYHHHRRFEPQEVGYYDPIALSRTFPEWHGLGIANASNTATTSPIAFPSQTACPAINAKYGAALREASCGTESCQTAFANSAYDLGLAEWMQVYGPENVHVVVQSDLEERPGETMTRVFNFLGLDPDETGGAHAEKHRVYPNPLKPGDTDLPPPAECRQLRTLFKPHLECLDALLPHSKRPLSKLWSQCP